MHFLDGRIVGAIHRSQCPVAGDAALEFCRHFLHRSFFERIGATAEEKDGAREKERDSEGLQARRILKKVTSDKWRVTSLETVDVDD